LKDCPIEDAWISARCLVKREMFMQLTTLIIPNILWSMTILAKPLKHRYRTELACKKRNHDWYTFYKRRHEVTFYIGDISNCIWKIMKIWSNIRQIAWCLPWLNEGCMCYSSTKLIPEIVVMAPNKLLLK